MTIEPDVHDIVATIREGNEAEQGLKPRSELTARELLREVGRRHRRPGNRNLDGFGVVEHARELGTRERHPAPHHCRDEERGRARENAGRSQHEELLPVAPLSMVSARLTGPCGSVKHCCARSSSGARPRTATLRGG